MPAVPFPRLDGGDVDPWRWHLAITAVFAALVCWRLGIPSKIYFDEVHYVPAARKMLAHLPANAEHPLLGKSAIAAAIALWGDSPVVWRIPSAVMGVVGLFAFGRMLWWAGHIGGHARGRVASVAGMVLLATDFAWFIQSRIAMLDMVMAGFAMMALWLVAAACALPAGTPVWQRSVRLALGGVCLGLAMGAKWSVLPVVALVGLFAVAARGLTGGRAAMARADLAPFPGVSLVEILFYLGSVPLIAYVATFFPAFGWSQNAPSLIGLPQWHTYMLELQASVIKHHPYQSVWYQWVGNWRAIWYLYENVDGAQRGVVLIGNPFSMLVGLGALAWCGWATVRPGGRQRWDTGLVVALYAACLMLWIVGAKPVQFYYHYLLPGTFLMAALALAVEDLWQAGPRWRREALGIVVIAVGIFVWFWPIIAAMPLHKGAMSYEDWMWLKSWQ
ncbi:phospholipid carrier-dependent glycosyltransferase [Novosphingobium sp. FSY-8]|uniref:Polyprenol-phosphate-mannose--protein mannosyltransferase n=2 Tax=Novosphingobium ovatum TaxID=1908523 RepID=A0ABW9X9H0_9SPHN|nr:phospholipid carrier-dependent glycosyltransferase [Novosphingobium ovatum]